MDDAQAARNRADRGDGDGASGASGSGASDSPDPVDWESFRAQLQALLEDCPDAAAGLASAAALLHHASSRFFWTGFYLPATDGSGDLVVGPYQGPLACVRLPAGRGVCGAAAVERRSQVVPDVHAWADHIACSAASRSEIVVPLLDGETLRGVLDIDSDHLAAFDDRDRAGLERVAACVVAFLKRVG